MNPTFVIFIIAACISTAIRALRRACADQGPEQVGGLTFARLPLQKDRMPWHLATRTKQSTMPACSADMSPITCLLAEHVAAATKLGMVAPLCNMHWWHQKEDLIILKLD